MRNKKIISAVLFCSILLTGCGSKKDIERETRTVESATTVQATDTAESTEQGTEQNSNILIAYFTRADNINVDPDVDIVSSASINHVGSDYEGNVEIMANYIQELTGGDTFSIMTVELYPSGYDDTTDVAKTEQNDDARPVLANSIANMDSYDTIYLGYPNWWGGLPMAMYSFLEAYDFSGKTIIPFASHGGSGLGTGPSEIAELCPDATIGDGIEISASSVSDSKAEIEEWINK